MADFGPDCPWELHPSVGLRPEPFGALAYHYGTRRLTFLKDRLLTDVVRCLARHPDVPSALVASGISPARESTYLAALDRLAQAGVIRQVTDKQVHAGHELEVTSVR